MSACLILATTHISKSQSGTLDNTFGTGGIVTTTIGSSYASGRSIAIQSDGKIVVAGYYSNGSNYDFALVRYNSNGILDATFGTNGIVSTPIGSFDDNGNSVVIQNDGKIIVVGYSNNGTNNDFVVVRYNSNGVLDNNFGTGGKITTDFGSTNDYAYSVAIQSDGKIIVAGKSSNGAYAFAIARYNIDGSLDNTFGTGGKLTTFFGSGNAEGYSVAIQSDGKIVVAGSSYNGTNFDFALVRYNSNGTLDNNFGLSGIVSTDFYGHSDLAYSVVIQNDSKIVLAGCFNNGSSEHFAIARYNSNGTLDNTFNSNGKVVTYILSPGDYANSVAIHSDGKIVVGGYSYQNPLNHFSLVQYNSDGSLDNNFGGTGEVVTAIGSHNSYGYSVAIQSDGKIIMAGLSYYSFAVVRYNNTVTTGINAITEQNKKVEIFPNPFNSQAIINFNEAQKNTIIKIMDVHGKEIKEINFTGNQLTIDKDEMKKGIYFIKITDIKNNVVNKKLILQ